MFHCNKCGQYFEWTEESPEVVPVLSWQPKKQPEKNAADRKKDLTQKGEHCVLAGGLCFIAGLALAAFGFLAAENAGTLVIVGIGSCAMFIPLLILAQLYFIRATLEK